MRTNTLKTLFLTVLAIGTFFLSGCWDETHPGTYYTFQGKTVASDLTGNPDYSDFVRVLERTGLLRDLSTYGHYTCFAPNNAAMEKFLRERGLRYSGLDAPAGCNMLYRRPGSRTSPKSQSE